MVSEGEMRQILPITGIFCLLYIHLKCSRALWRRDKGFLLCSQFREQHKFVSSLVVKWTTNKLWPVGTDRDYRVSTMPLCYLCPEVRYPHPALPRSQPYSWVTISGNEWDRGWLFRYYSKSGTSITLPVSLNQLFIALGEASTSHPISTLLPTGAATSWLDTLINGRTATRNSQMIYKIMSPCKLNSTSHASHCRIYCTQLWTQLREAKRWGNVRETCGRIRGSHTS